VHEKGLDIAQSVTSGRMVSPCCSALHGDRTACIRNPHRLQSPAMPALRLALSNSDCATGEGGRRTVRG
jgi:hypothetical protein